MGLLSPARIRKLGENPAARTSPVEFGPIDPSRPFIPEEYTQLYYTRHYSTLTRPQRLRYNQLFGIRVNEQTMAFEEEFSERILQRLVRHPRVVANADLRDCVSQMIEEEQGHGEMFLELNRRCLPEIYEHRSRYFTRLGRLDALAFRLATARPYWLTFLLWFITALEEYSIHLSRAYIRGDPVDSLGELEPNFVRLHAEHAKDEPRHVHTGLNLIDACAGSAVKRRLNASLFIRFIHDIAVPKRAGVIVVQRLVTEHPELEPRRDELIAGLRDLKNDERFQKSLFNRSLMPLTFRHLDGKSEFRNLGRAMRGYDRRAPV